MARTRGFTLLELLVVVAVLVIVATAAVVSLGGAEDDARVQLARTELATLRDACRRWKADLGSYPPDPSVDFPGLPSAATVTAATGLTPLVGLAVGPSSLWTDATQLASGLLPNPPAPIALATGETPMSKLGLFSLAPFATLPALESWNPATRRGWRGPYVGFPATTSESPSVAIPLRVLVLDEGRAVGTYELADPWNADVEAAVLATTPSVRRQATDPARHSVYAYALRRDPLDVAAPAAPTRPPVGFTITTPGPDGVRGTADDVTVSDP